MRRIGILLIALGCSRVTSTNGDRDAAIDATTQDACVPSPFPPHVVYLNRFGGDYKIGNPDNSTTNTSAVLSANVSLPAPTIVVPGDWDPFVACVKDKFLPFNVIVSEFDPGTTTHTELVVIDNAQQIGLPAGVGSIAPFECLGTSGNFQYNGVPFLMWQSNGPEDMCWLGAQAIGTSMGLDHAYSCAELMSYLKCGPTMNKTFMDVDILCGENQARPCICGGSSQSSARWLRQMVGPTCK